MNHKKNNKKIKYKIHLQKVMMKRKKTENKNSDFIMIIMWPQGSFMRQ